MFVGSAGALAVMTVLSAAMGWAAPNLVRFRNLHGSMADWLRHQFRYLAERPI